MLGNTQKNIDNGGNKMNKKFKQVILGITAAAACAVMASCGGGQTTSSGGDADKITYWCILDANTSQTASNLGDTQFAKKLMEVTGAKIEYQHPAQGQAGEKFNIMVAMGNLPDIIEYSWNSGYPGGFSKAMSDGVIQAIDAEKEAPNMMAYIKEHPELDKMLKTDDGKYYGYPFIRGDEYLLTSAGMIVRDDWLSDLGIADPETIDDWTAMLTAFKEKKGAKAPLTVTSGFISNQGVIVGAFGIYDGLYIDGGTVKYGPMEDAYKDFLVQMNSWYQAGLLDADYASVDGSTIQSNMLNGVSGATFGSCGQGIGKWMAAAPDDKYSLKGVKYPVLKKGDVPQFGNYQYPVTPTVAVISRDCKNKELCTKVLDYGYGAEGQMLFNFGIEGESYNMVDGYPTYTDLITKNPEGLSMSAALAKYTRAHTESAFIQDKRYMEQYANLPQQKAALTNWMATNMKEHRMPDVSLTSEQQSDISTLLENLDTYKSEMQAKFIMGVEPIENFDKFRDELRNRGVEKYLGYQQEAYERYLKR